MAEQAQKLRREQKREGEEVKEELINANYSTSPSLPSLSPSPLPSNNHAYTPLQWSRKMKMIKGGFRWANKLNKHTYALYTLLLPFSQALV